MMSCVEIKQVHWMMISIYRWRHWWRHRDTTDVNITTQPLSLSCCWCSGPLVAMTTSLLQTQERSTPMYTNATTIDANTRLLRLCLYHFLRFQTFFTSPNANVFKKHCQISTQTLKIPTRHTFKTTIPTTFVRHIIIIMSSNNNNNDDDDNNNNNNNTNVYGHHDYSHFESSPGSCDECRPETL